MDPAASPRQRFLLVRGGGREHLLPLERVLRVLGGVRLYPFPGAPPAVKGLAEVGGEPLVVLDLVRLTGSAAGLAGQAGVVVLVKAGPVEEAETVGLAVDEALDILELPLAEITPASQGLVAGDAVIAGRLVPVLDLAALAGEA